MNTNIIPKVIHYCWFGRRPLPALAVKCIQSWRKYFPDYEIKEWNEDNFNVNSIAYTREAYKSMKYAFVSDYARFWILYHYGGLYFDVDVEVIKPMDHIINQGAFMGFENNGMEDNSTEAGYLGVNPGLGMGAPANMGIYKVIIEYYQAESFYTPLGRINQTTVVTRVTDLLLAYGLKQTNQLQEVEGIRVYPYEYFCPIRTTDSQINITKNTVSIHHYAASWTTVTHRLVRQIVLFIGGTKLKMFLSKLFLRWKK